MGNVSKSSPENMSLIRDLVDGKIDRNKDHLEPIQQRLSELKTWAEKRKQELKGRIECDVDDALCDLQPQAKKQLEEDLLTLEEFLKGFDDIKKAVSSKLQTLQAEVAVVAATSTEVPAKKESEVAPEVSELKYSQEELPAKLEEITSFLVAIYNTGSLTSNDMSSILSRKAEILAVLEQSRTARFAKTQDFIKNVDKLTEAVSGITAKYAENKKDKSFASNPEFEAFLDSANLKIAQGVFNEADILEEELEGITDEKKLLEYYERFKENDGFRMLVLKRIVDVGNYRVFKEQNGLVLKDSTGVVKSDLSQKIRQKDLMIMQLEQIRKSMGIERFDKLDEENVVNTLFEKYAKEGLKDGEGVYTYDDIFNPDKKNDIVKKINELINSNQKDLNKLQELEFLLSIVENPQKNVFSMGPETLTQLVSLGGIKDENGNELNRISFMQKIKEHGNGKVSNGLLNRIMGANGGLTGVAIIMMSVVGLFIPSWRKKVLIGWAAILGITTMEELGREAGLIKWAKKEFPELGKMLESVSDGFSGPDYAIKNLPSDYNYDDMYKQNLQKREKGDRQNTLSEETFAQIYGQMITKPEFNKMTIDELRQITPDNIKNKLGAELPTVYKEGLLELESNDKQLHKGKIITQGEVYIFIQQLLKQQEATQGDKTAGDLFVVGVQKNETYVGVDDEENFKTQNEAIAGALMSIDLSDPNREAIKTILEELNSYKSKAEDLVTDPKDRVKKLEETIDKLNSLSLSGNTKTQVDIIIKQLSDIIAILNNSQVVEDFVENVTDKADLGLWGAEGVSKDAWNSIVGGLAVMVGYFNLPASWTLERVRTASLDDINKLILEGEKVLKKNQLSESQKEKVREMLLELRQKKLVLLNAKAEVGTPQDKQKARAEAKKVLAELINVNTEKYKEKLETAKQNIVSLSRKPTDENIQSYITLIVSNYETIKFLRELEDADTNSLSKDKEAEKLQKQAKELLKENSEKYQKNLEDYIALQLKKLDDLQRQIANADISSIDILHKQFESINSEFGNDSSIFNELRKTINSYVLKELNFKEIEKGQTAVGKLNGYLLVTLGLSSVVPDSIGSKLPLVKQALEAKNKALMETIKIPEFRGDVMNKDEVKAYAEELKKLKNGVSNMSGEPGMNVLKKAKEKAIKKATKNLVSMFTAKLEQVKDNPDDVTKLHSNYQIAKDKVADFFEDFPDEFEDALEELIRRKEEEEFNEKLKTMKLSELDGDTKRILELFVDEYESYKYDNLTFAIDLLRDKNKTMNEIIDLLTYIEGLTGISALGNKDGNNELTEDKLRDLKSNANSTRENLINSIKGNWMGKWAELYAKIKVRLK